MSYSRPYTESNLYQTNKPPPPPPPTPPPLQAPTSFYGRPVGGPSVVPTAILPPAAAGAGLGSYARPSSAQIMTPHTTTPAVFNPTNTVTNTQVPDGVQRAPKRPRENGPLISEGLMVSVNSVFGTSSPPPPPAHAPVMLPTHASNAAMTDTTTGPSTSYRRPAPAESVGSASLNILPMAQHPYRFVSQQLMQASTATDPNAQPTRAKPPPPSVPPPSVAAPAPKIGGSGHAHRNHTTSRPMQQKKGGPRRASPPPKQHQQHHQNRSSANPPPPPTVPPPSHLSTSTTTSYPTYTNTMNPQPRPSPPPPSYPPGPCVAATSSGGLASFTYLRAPAPLKATIHSPPSLPRHLASTTASSSHHMPAIPPPTIPPAIPPATAAPTTGGMSYCRPATVPTPSYTTVTGGHSTSALDWMSAASEQSERVPTPPPAGYPRDTLSIVVFDTCALMELDENNFSLLSMMRRVAFAIPFAVIKELDGHNKSQMERRKDAARRARDWILSSLREGRSMRIQRRDEVDTAYDRTATANDDHIVGFAVFLRREEEAHGGRPRRVYLCTDDKIMQISAQAEGLDVCDHKEVLKQQF